MKNFVKTIFKKIPGVITCINKTQALYYRLMFNDKNFKLHVYTKRHNRKPNLEHPKSFTEKLLWCSLNYRDNRFVWYADKYTVREHVKSVIGEEYLIPLYDVVDRAEDMDFEKYPKRFVMNATHGSNMVILCSDKSKFDVVQAKKMAKKWLHTNYYNVMREWHYKYITPRVLIMENISGADGKAPWDYKFFCFDGEPYVVALDLERFGDTTMRNVYDMDWKQVKDVKISRPQDYEHNYPKPKNFELMKDLCKKLAKGFNHVRVDFYNVDGKIYFGELTFLHAAAGISGNITPWDYDLKLGEMYNLPTRNVDGWSYKEK